MLFFVAFIGFAATLIGFFFFFYGDTISTEVFGVVLAIVGISIMVGIGAAAIVTEVMRVFP